MQPIVPGEELVPAAGVAGVAAVAAVAVAVEVEGEVLLMAGFVAESEEVLAD